ncbi:ABC transporter substrate-binding protein [Solicola gregarius]|uniref:ABC transporter substrate-binding protein n=1 Tax=Solicola gregarius TaxID=2908642 RepID=A0AA46TGL5_9ACTN|nr:ABC transporter substrate-binding protein [Solicola gregarius]UYM04818.1 ABC transporter substrate-binding protein [Solicola gregarius]
MRWKRWIAATSAVGLMALAACGGNSDLEGDSEDSINSQSSAATGKDPDAEAPAPPIDGAEEGGTMKVLSTEGMNSIHPQDAYYYNTMSITTGLMFRTLTQYVYRDGQMVLVPDLATDLGQPNEDFTEWTFEIRDGVRWENGDEVTADDVARGIKASFDRDTFTAGPAYANTYFEGGDTYKGLYSDPKTEPEAVTVDGNKVIIKMATPFADMDYFGALPAMSPLPDTDEDPADYARHPMSTGPYKIDSYDIGKKMTLVKNDEWDPNTDPGRHQYVDEYDFDLQIGSSAQIENLILGDQGDAQATISIDNVTQANAAKAKEQDQLVSGASACGYFLNPDYRKVTDINIRKAIGLAFPYEDSWLAEGQIIGTTRAPATMISAPSVPGRIDPPYDVLDNSGQETDTAAAKKLLEKADAVGYELKWVYTGDDPMLVDMKDAMVRSFEEAGFKVSPVKAADDQETSELNQDPDAPVNLRRTSWCADWPSGAVWIPPILSKKYPGSNYAHFTEPDIEKRIDEVQQMPSEDQPEGWAQLEKDAMEKYYPTIPIGYTGAALLEGSRIEGMHVDEVFGNPTWKSMWVASE